MARSLVILWLTLLGAISAIGVLAQFWVTQREKSSLDRVEAILASRLDPINASIGRVLESYSIEIQRILANSSLSDAMDCLEITRAPQVKMLVVADAKNQLRYPNTPARLSTDDATLVDEAMQLIREVVSPSTKGDSKLAEEQAIEQTSIVGAQPSAKNSPKLQSRVYRELPSRRSRAQDESPAQTVADNQQLEQADGASQETALPVEPFGWITWYHRRSLVLGFWWQQDPSYKSVVMLPSSRWTSELIATLPENTLAKDSSGAGALNQLVDVEGNLVYQWGDAAEESWNSLLECAPHAELAVTEPLDGWRLRVYANSALERQLVGDDWIGLIWVAVAGISVALILSGVLATLTLNRTMRLAETRVSFVNQVSHELRTPLTNICMYADLLANDMEATESENAQLGRINVIQNESRRLNRLINNVLQFARTGNPNKQLQKTANVMDELVTETLETFRPGLQELAFEIVLDIHTAEPRYFDRGAIEQVLVNLIGNAEKYAHSGKYLAVRSHDAGDDVVLEIEDKGPGIPARMAEKIFLPFERLSNRLEQPAGTGIGLSISRDICRQHGGDCVLVNYSNGCNFRCSLHAPIVSSMNDII